MSDNKYWFLTIRLDVGQKMISENKNRRQKQFLVSDNKYGCPKTNSKCLTTFLGI